ncbi:MAG: LTA synthase family protein [Oscillospiraceae bacterium]|nr:LTA synthase family protein [Oscillospiraceae bacterium]
MQTWIATVVKNKKQNIIALVVLYLAVILCTGLFFEDTVQETALFIAAFVWATLLVGVYNLSFTGTQKQVKGIRMVCFCAATLLSFFGTEILNDNHLFENTYILYWILNIILYLFLYLCVNIFLHRTWLCMVVTGSVIYAFGVVNHFVLCFRGGPILPWDIYAVQTAISVSGTYRLSLSAPLIVSGLIFANLLVLALRLRPFEMQWYVPRKARYYAKKSVGVAALAVSCFYLIFISPAHSWFNLEMYPWRYQYSYHRMGYLVASVENICESIIIPPTGYGTKKVQQLVAKVKTAQDAPSLTGPEGTGALTEETVPVQATPEGIQPQSTQTQTTATPNLIVIMNESMADLEVINSFNTSDEPLAFFNSLTENTIRGNLYTPTIGGGTCNTEYEFLTGNSLQLFPHATPYQQFVTSPSKSLVSTLKQQGYTALAVHPYYDTGWSRNKVYPFLGFDTFYSSKDFRRPTMVRGYISDISSFKKDIELFEQKQPGEPLFIFNVTMQNHSYYDTGKIKQTVTLTDYDQFRDVNEYLSLLRMTDEAFMHLISYFKKVEEPTLILMFGDHQPAVSDDFIEELYGKPLDELTDEENMRRYITPFVLWANYDIEEKEIDAISANYLSTLLLETAGLKLTPYNSFLSQMYDTIPVVGIGGYMSADRKFYSYEDKTPYTQMLNEYSILEYNNVFGGLLQNKTAFAVN